MLIQASMVMRKLSQTSGSTLINFSSTHRCVFGLLIFCRQSCTNYFPVLLCTTKLAQTTSQYYCVLQSLHKPLPSTTVYYKGEVVCTTKLAQTTSQYYFVLQSVHKLLPSTTVYYKACTNYFPVHCGSNSEKEEISAYK